MIRSLDIVAAESGVTVEQVTVWVERHWVRPIRSNRDLAFDEADLARLKMIVEFRRDLAIDDEAMPVVLDLLDRLYATRAQLATVLAAVGELPETTRFAIVKRMTGRAE